MTGETPDAVLADCPTCGGEGVIDVRAYTAAAEAAHARDLAALRERAEVAEAKVAAVEALADRWEHNEVRHVRGWVDLRLNDLRTALALTDPPGRAGTADPGART